MPTRRRRGGSRRRRRTAMSVDSSIPTTSAREPRAVGQDDGDVRRRRSTTWAFVRMVPSSRRTMPEPATRWRRRRSPSMRTTDGLTPSATATRPSVGQGGGVDGGSLDSDPLDDPFGHVVAEARRGTPRRPGRPPRPRHPGADDHGPQPASGAAAAARAPVDSGSRRPASSDGWRQSRSSGGNGRRGPPAGPGRVLGKLVVGVVAGPGHEGPW